MFRLYVKKKKKRERSITLDEHRNCLIICSNFLMFIGTLMEQAVEKISKIMFPVIVSDFFFQ